MNHEHWPRATVRATIYVVVLLAINAYIVKRLFFAEFTDNMQTNAGSFMAISRFIIKYWPHLDWFPWWFNGEPFENSYTPMLHFVDAGVAWLVGWSTPRAYNFMTGLFYATGPAFLFLFAWLVSRRLETSFAAAMLYSLFSPAALFSNVREDLGGLSDPWRVRVLVQWGEGPHITALSVLPLALLFMYFAVTRRKYGWFVAACIATAFVTLVNAFGAIDLAVGGACLVLAFQKKVEMPRAALLIGVIALTAYLWASPFLPPSLLKAVSSNSQHVDGDFSSAKLLPMQCAVLAALAVVWFATRWIGDYFARFSVMFAFVFVAIVSLDALAHRATLPQPHRYTAEMEFGVALTAAFALRPLIARLPGTGKLVAGVIAVALATHQVIEYRRYARLETRAIDVTQTIEYKIAKWTDANLGGKRAFIGAQAGTWLNVFTDTPQFDAGHRPFNPNFYPQQSAGYQIYSGASAGQRETEVAILWLKAFGCQAVSVSGPKSRVADKPYRNPKKFEGALPVLWHEEDDTIYAVPQRTSSLAHVVPEDAIVQHMPMHGLDTAETERYVRALDDASLPEAEMTWSAPGAGHIRAIVHPGQVISVQSTFDPGWIAIANGQRAAVSHDGIGLSVIHTRCDGPCAVDFIFDGGLERKICRALSWLVTIGAIAGALIARKSLRRKAL